ncbi:MAG TPA: hypothetical protein VHB48_16680, partial [Chitinophagaceae bacterium]|nr:hypothetical protein [Chitinophagaceae bacterium]
MKKTLFTTTLFAVTAFAAGLLTSCSSNNGGVAEQQASSPVADTGNAGLKLPQGFGALVVADSLTSPRHLAVTKEGDIYVKLAKLKDGNGIIWLHPGANGKVAESKGFGNYTGTGMYVENGYLYASSDEEVFRYKLDSSGKVIDGNSPEKIVTGLLSRHEHEAKAITLDDNGNVYVNI